MWSLWWDMRKKRRDAFQTLEMECLLKRFSLEILIREKRRVEMEQHPMQFEFLISSINEFSLSFCCHLLSPLHNVETRSHFPLTKLNGWMEKYKKNTRMNAAVEKGRDYVWNGEIIARQEIEIHERKCVFIKKNFSRPAATHKIDDRIMKMGARKFATLNFALLNRSIWKLNNFHPPVSTFNFTHMMMTTALIIILHRSCCPTPTVVKCDIWEGRKIGIILNVREILGWIAYSKQNVEYTHLSHQFSVSFSASIVICPRSMTKTDSLEFFFLCLKSLNKRLRIFSVKGMKKSGKGWNFTEYWKKSISDESITRRPRIFIHWMQWKFDKKITKNCFCCMEWWGEMKVIIFFHPFNSIYDCEGNKKILNEANCNWSQMTWSFPFHSHIQLQLAITHHAYIRRRFAMTENWNALHKSLKRKSCKWELIKIMN